jgi:hypothetical protein
MSWLETELGKDAGSVAQERRAGKDFIPYQQAAGFAAKSCVCS